MKRALLEASSPSNEKKIFDYLMKINPAPNIEEPVVKTLVMMDATGSMGSLINKAKNTVSIMFKRIQAILE